MRCIPQSRLPVLPADPAGAVAVELGCCSAYISAWLARRGGQPVGVDVSARQLAIARYLQDEFGLRFKDGPGGRRAGAAGRRLR